MGGKNAGIDPGGREEGRMPGSILTGGKNAGIDPGGREECWDRSWRAGRMLESILAGGKREECRKICICIMKYFCFEAKYAYVQ
jgi:hypothetical protein